MHNSHRNFDDVTAGFPKTARLLNKQDFQRVFDDARPFREAGHLLLVKPNDLGHARIGFVLAKKKVRRAVDRNRIKRLARESFRLDHHNLPAVDIILLCHPRVNSLANSEILQSLSKQWRRIGKFYRQSPPQRSIVRLQSIPRNS